MVKQVSQPSGPGASDPKGRERILSYRQKHPDATVQQIWKATKTSFSAATVGRIVQWAEKENGMTDNVASETAAIESETVDDMVAETPGPEAPVEPVSAEQVPSDAQASESLQQIRDELGLKIVKLDPGDVSIPLVGEILGALDRLLAQMGDVAAGPFENGIACLKKLLELVVLDDLEAHEGLSRVYALSEAIDDGIDDFQVRGVLNEAMLRQAIEAACSGIDLLDLGEFAATAKAAPTASETSSADISDASDPANLVIQHISNEVLTDGVLAEFLDEASDCLESAEENLLALEKNIDDRSLIDGIFRPVHTVKGGAGFLELATINTVCHRAEDLLVKLRDQEIMPTPEIVDCLLKVVDVVRQLLNQARDLIRQSGGEVVNLEPIEIDGVLRQLQQVDSCSPKTCELPIGQILVQTQGVPKEDVDDALEIQSRPLGEILIEQGKATTDQVERALKLQKPTEKSGLQEVVKVPSNKLDELSALVGELVVSMSVLTRTQLNGSFADRQTQQRIDQMGKTTEQLRERVLDVRMFPIGSVFSKLSRQVRDVARKVNKDVRLETAGENTRLDKSIIDELFAPLSHVVRNAIDHGLESPQEREAAGKPATGTIRLEARHLGDNVVVEVIDDGRGLDPEKVKAKAVDLGLMKPDAPLTDELIHSVIFRPGVSTAKEITDISGRGVGLDVVKKAVDKLRGKIQVRSEPGQGMTMGLKLPLTTSIIEGLVVRVGTSRFVLPILSVNETVRPRKEELRSVHDREGLFFLLHGELVPILRLYQFYGIEAERTDPSRGLVVVIRDERGLHGILVDELLHRQQVVIKNLGERFARLVGVTGGTILGDGSVGLILDPEEIVRADAEGGSVALDEMPSAAETMQEEMNSSLEAATASLAVESQS